jgi:hypothetical protein
MWVCRCGDQCGVDGGFHIWADLDRCPGEYLRTVAHGGLGDAVVSVWNTVILLSRVAGCASCLRHVVKHDEGNWMSHRRRFIVSLV